MKKTTLSLFFITFMGVSAFAQTIVSTSPQNKKVILEEFTGVNCVYCPQGHAIANNISFAAFVVGADNKAINVRESHINEAQTFQINP